MFNRSIILCTTHQHHPPHLNSFLFVCLYLCRHPTGLTRRWFWINCGTPACWKRWRSGVQGFPSDALLKTSWAGKGLANMIDCTVLHSRIVYSPTTTSYYCLYEGIRLFWRKMGNRQQLMEMRRKGALICSPNTTTPRKTGSWGRPRWAHLSFFLFIFLQFVFLCMRVFVLRLCPLPL